MKAEPERTTKEQKLQSVLILLKDLEDLGPYYESFDNLEAHCLRISRELELYVGRTNKRTDPVRHDKANSLLRQARGLQKKVKSAKRCNSRTPSAALIYGYGTLFGQLSETLTS